MRYLIQSSSLDRFCTVLDASKSGLSLKPTVRLTDEASFNRFKAPRWKDPSRAEFVAGKTKSRPERIRRLGIFALDELQEAGGLAKVKFFV